MAACIIAVLASACDIGDAPDRDDGDGGEELAGADPSPSGLPSASPSPTSGTPGDPSSGPKPRFAFPRAGTYVYAQEGFEEICTPSCAGDPLPRKRTVTVGYARSSRDAISTVEIARVSSHRTTTTVTRHRRALAAVVQVRDRFETRGSTFRIGFRPGPPIRALVLPLDAGAAWRGSWDAGTSGSYRIGVHGYDHIEVAGGRHRAARVQARIEFGGDMEGHVVTTWWVDPRTRMVIASVGSMELRDGFGRYRTDFDTRLTRGPGYG